MEVSNKAYDGEEEPSRSEDKGCYDGARLGADSAGEVNAWEADQVQGNGDCIANWEDDDTEEVKDGCEEAQGDAKALSRHYYKASHLVPLMKHRIARNT